MSLKPKVVVVGSGPNGLAAAITVARAGYSVRVLEANDTVGGACRSAELTKPGFVHDVGSSIHPLAVCSPFMQTIPWGDHGMTWVHPPASVAHPLDGGRAAMGWSSFDRTVDDLGPDGERYRQVFKPLVEKFDQLVGLTMQSPASMALSPIAAARFGPLLALPATVTAKAFRSEEAKALFAGHAAHAIAPLTKPFTSGFGALLGGASHAIGWPFPKGGANEIVRVLTEVLTELGGEIVTGHRVDTMDDLPGTDATIFALTPRQIEQIAGQKFNARSRRSLRGFRYGPGACKVDFATNAPIPWTNPNVSQAGTVHLGGTIDEIVKAEATVNSGDHAEQPFVLLAQHSAFDETRAPAGSHTVWTYCHVPNGSTLDQSAAIENQIERFAPGFKQTIVAKHVSLTSDLEQDNANLVGGDVGGGSYVNLRAVLRPRPAVRPHTLPVPGFFIGSASTSPGAGVHGMGGHLAAKDAMRYLAQLK